MFSAQLKKEHQMIMGKYKELWAHGAFDADIPAEQTKTMVVELVKLIMVHSAAETSVLYPLLDQMPKQGHEAALKCVGEHAEVEFLLYQLVNADPSSNEFLATLKKVMGMVKKHSDEEEAMILPEVDNFLQAKGGDAMARTLAEYEYSKQHAPTVPHPAINRPGQGPQVARGILKTAEDAARMASSEVQHHMTHAHGVPIHAHEPDVVVPQRKPAEHKQ